jgi:hypothetical protein
MSTQLVSGLGGAIGSRYIRSRNQLVFVEFTAGKISAVDLIRPLVSTVSQGTTVINGTWVFDCETGTLGGSLSGPGDVWWDQRTTVERRMVPVGGAKIVNLGKINFDQVTHATLQTLTYGTVPIPGNDDATNQLVDGTVFAVLTNAGNYAKVQVLAYGYNMTVRWVTYGVGPRYRVLGTGYTEPEDIAVSANDVTAYVTERSGNLLRVSLSSANRASATVLASGMTAPHQIWLDEANGHAYVVEFAPKGRLLRIPLAGGTPTALVNNLENAIGLLITSDRSTAYVSEQAASGGRLVRITLNTGFRQVVATGLTRPFLLSWADGGEARILVTERDPANRLMMVDVTQVPATVTVAAGGLPLRPSSAAVVEAGRTLICCETEIRLIELPALTVVPTGPLLMGIGHVPFDRISPMTGRADTTVDPTYPYQFKDVPFGGTLPLLVNHQRAYALGARYYRVMVDGAPLFDSWTDYRWNAALNRYEARITSPVSLATGSGYYPVHSPVELFLWLHPALGSRMNSVGLSDALHTLRIDFVNEAGAAVASSDTLRVLINNRPCTATIAVPTLNGSPADPVCGTLKYPAGPSGTVTMAFTASHPNGFATYSFTLVKGVSTLTPPSTSGPVGAAPAAITASAAELLGKCGVAGFAERIYVATTIINGEVRQSQYDASAMIAFVLAPA